MAKATKASRKTSAAAWAQAQERRPKVRSKSGKLPLDAVYNKLPTLMIRQGVKRTTENNRRADVLFDQLMQSPLFKKYKVHEKRTYWHDYFGELVEAARIGACVLTPRDPKRPDCSKAKLNVQDCADDVGLIDLYRSPKGSPKMSRAIPAEPVKEQAHKDPWDYEPETPMKSYVILRKRGDIREELPFDPTDPIAADTHAKLVHINKVNRLYRIYYERWDTVQDCDDGAYRLRPIHYAIFTDNFQQHGRLYTGRYGHQSLGRRERKSIEFNGTTSVEMDYSGMHPRMVYHLEKIDYKEDPYRLWGDDTTPDMRLLAKVMVNALLNADSDTAAISACNRKLLPRTKGGEWKRGKALAESNNLRDALSRTNLTFKKIVPVVRAYHRRIDHYFGQDMGVKLMRVDSTIAINLLYHFTCQSIPCLGCHDSFLVPKYARNELFRVMHQLYFDALGIYPIVKAPKRYSGAVDG